MAFAPFHAGSSTPVGTIQQAVITRRNGTYLFLRMGPSVKAAEWFHVKLVILGTRLAVYVNHGREPVFVVDKVLDGKARGDVGVWSIGNTYFANFRYTPAK